MTPRSPISWIGGKFYVAGDIIALFPPHDHYIEVFSGALHVLFRKPKIILETVNDKDQDLVNFWLVCRDHMEELLPKLNWTPYSRALFLQWKKEPKPEDPIEAAARWFFRNGAAVNGLYRGGWSYQRKHATVRVPVAGKFRRRILRLEAVRDRLAGVQIECADFREMIDRYGGNEANLLYVDPPYVGTETMYEERFTEQDHVDLARMLHEAKARIALSYGDDPVTRKLYKTWQKERFTMTRHCTVGDGKPKPKKQEFLYMNYTKQPDLFA